VVTQSDLMLAILALDAYNRGDNPGMNFNGNSDTRGTLIGGATILSDDDTDPAQAASFQAASFYAIAYTWNGQTIISYRGTRFDGDATRYGRKYDIPPTEVFPLLPPWAVRELPEGDSYPPMSVVIDVSDAFRGFVACGARKEDRIEPDGSVSKFVALRDGDRANGNLPKYRFFVNNTEIRDYSGCNGHACFPQDVFHKDDYFLNQNSSGRYFE
jgi:hypothetical protein